MTGLFTDPDGPEAVRFSIIQRGRGVYLAEAHFDLTGDHEFDAFPTLAKAKRWAAGLIDRKRLDWVRADTPYLYLTAKGISQ